MHMAVGGAADGYKIVEAASEQQQPAPAVIPTECSSSTTIPTTHYNNYNHMNNGMNVDESLRSGTSAMDIISSSGSASPFLHIGTNINHDDDGKIRRTGNVWTASAHVITAVIGSGVLSLAWSMSQVGWVAGPAILLAFAAVTYYTAVLLADCYRYPHPVTGRRNYTYMDAVKSNLGENHVWLCGLVQYINLIGTSVGYTITSSISMVAIERSNCFHRKGHNAECHVSNNPYMILFGVLQMVLSQIPDFDRLSGLSAVAAFMSFAYSSIALALAIARASESGHSHGTLTGLPSVATAVAAKEQKAWGVFQALGNIAFAYSFTAILIEIQDTLKSPPPPENATMKRASLIGIAITTVYYVSVGCAGYAAFGDAAPGNILTGFGFYNPYWLVDIANVCIVVHLVGAYQVFTQPVFAFVENWAGMRWPSYHRFLTMAFDLKLPAPTRTGGIGFIVIKLTLFKLLWRSLFVALTTLVSIILPFFNDILGLLGATGFWPLTVYFPISMHISQHQVKPWSPQWIGLQALSAVCLLVSLAAGLGSVAGIVADLKRYSPFKTQS